MLIDSSATVHTTRLAIGTTLAALAAASQIDVDCSEEDRLFFAAEHAKLAPHAVALADVAHAIEEHDLGPGLIRQVSVDLGDFVLVRGLRRGNKRTRLELQGKPGLGADHVFGAGVDDLARARLAEKPTLVLQAAARLDDVVDFSNKAGVKADLAQRATQQKALIDARTQGRDERNKLESTARRQVAEAATALASTKGALDQRFPRQRHYVASFFLDVGPKRTSAKSAAPTQDVTRPARPEDAKPAAPEEPASPDAPKG